MGGRFILSCGLRRHSASWRTPAHGMVPPTNGVFPLQLNFSGNTL
ncbi:hypothetical protein LEMLEM_LOCUS23010, partial [Lemmus lemmus]